MAALIQFEANLKAAAATILEAQSNLVSHNAFRVDDTAGVFMEDLTAGNNKYGLRLHNPTADCAIVGALAAAGAWTPPPQATGRTAIGSITYPGVGPWNYFNSRFGAGIFIESNGLTSLNVYIRDVTVDMGLPPVSSYTPAGGGTMSGLAGNVDCMTIDGDSSTYVRDCTFYNSHDGGIDAKGDLYMDNCHIQAGYRLLRCWRSATVRVANSTLRLPSAATPVGLMADANWTETDANGFYFLELVTDNASYEFYNCTFIDENGNDIGATIPASRIKFDQTSHTEAQALAKITYLGSDPSWRTTNDFFTQSTGAADPGPQPDPSPSVTQAAVDALAQDIFNKTAADDESIRELLISEFQDDFGTGTVPSIDVAVTNINRGSSVTPITAKSALVRDAIDSFNAGELSGDGGGALPVEQSASRQTANDQGTASNSLTVNAPTNLADGDLILLLYMSDRSDTGTPTTTIHTPPADFTEILDYGHSDFDVNIGACWKIATGSEPPTYTVTIGTSENWCISAHRITGHHPTTPIDVAPGTPNGAFANTIDVTGVTTGQDNCLAIGLLGADGADMSPFTTSGTGWEEIADVATTGGDGNNAAMTCAKKDQATAGATGNWTVTPSTTDGMMGVVFSIAPAV